MRALRPTFAIRAIAALLTLVSVAATAAPLGAEVQWKDPSSVQLEVDFPGNGYHASWQLFRCDCGDLLIRSELVAPGEVTQGDILLVANRAVLMRGYGPNAEEEVSFDAPALMMQLALRLLERAEPAGPSAISERRQVEVEDKINYINLDSGAAAGRFPAPWSVTGSVWPQADSQRRFDLVFTFNAAGAAGTEEQQGQMRLIGVAEYAASEFPLAVDMSLQEWKLSWRDDNDAAAEQAEKAKTLDELRQLLKAK
jgi:hypothetical protein